MKLPLALALCVGTALSAQAEPTARFATIFGEKIRYYDEGSGP